MWNIEFFVYLFPLIGRALHYGGGDNGLATAPKYIPSIDRCESWIQRNGE